MPIPGDSNNTLPQYTPTHDFILTMNQLTAKVQEQEQLLQSMQCQMSHMIQYVENGVQQQSPFSEFLHQRDFTDFLRYQQQLRLFYSNYYGMPWPDAPPAICSEALPQQQQQPASIVAHHQAHNQVEEAPNSPTRSPPPPTPTPHQVEYCYAPRTLSAHEGEQGNYNMPIVWFHAKQDTMQSQAIQNSHVATEPVATVPYSNNTITNGIHDIQIPMEISQWASWNPSTVQENYPQN